MKQKVYEVYKIINSINGKVYVGISSNGYKTRWYKHCSDSLCRPEFPIHNAIRKYGVDNFTVEVIETCDTSEQLKEQEKYWIKELKSRTTENGYNLTDGGDGTFGRLHSDETKQKIGIKHTKEILQYSIDKQYITKYNSLTDACIINSFKSKGPISACARGERNSAYGYIWEYLEKPKSIKVEKSRMSEEVKKRISETNKLRWNDERRLKYSINNIKNKPILQYDLEGNYLKEFRNVAEAVKEVGASTHTNICKCARGIRQKSCGYIWKYKN